MALIIRDQEDLDIDWAALLKNRSCHYVSVAMPGLTVVSANIEHAGGFDTRQRNDLMMKVNHARETGTLHPRVNITLIPSPSANYTGMDVVQYHHGDYPQEDVVAHILDAFEANTKHVKSDKMYFDFRCLCVSDTLYVSCLRKAMQTLPKQVLPEVITWRPGIRF